EGRFRKKPGKLFSPIIQQVCCRELVLLVEEDGNYRFLHQTFRDYYAAKHVMNLIEISIFEKSIPSILKEKSLDINTSQLVGEMEEEHLHQPVWLESSRCWQLPPETKLSRLLDICRFREHPEEKEIGYCIWNILNIWMK